MRAFAITGMETASMMPWIMSGVAHARDTTLRPDVGGHPLQRHHGDGPGVLGDLGLGGVDDVHDDAALQHLAMPRLTRAVPIVESVAGRSDDTVVPLGTGG